MATITSTEICKHKTFLYATVQVDIFSVVFCLEGGVSRIVNVGYPSRSFISGGYRERCLKKASKAFDMHVQQLGQEWLQAHIMACDLMQQTLEAGFDLEQLEGVFNSLES